MMQKFIYALLRLEHGLGIGTSVSKWFVEAEATTGGLARFGFLCTCKRVSLVPWREILGRGEEPCMKLNPEETGQQHARG